MLRHCFGDAVAALRLTYTRALAAPTDSDERAIVRSALARRCRFWGCAGDPLEWLGSVAHRQAAAMIEAELEKTAFDGETSDFFIWYEALLAPVDDVIREEKRARGTELGPVRPSVRLEHTMDRWGEALCGGGEHRAWWRGSSCLISEVLEEGSPALFVNAGAVRIEHYCANGPRGPKLMSFNGFAKRWGVVRTATNMKTYNAVKEELAGSGVQLVASGVTPLSARQLHDGVREMEGSLAGLRGWPCGDEGPRAVGSSAFRDLLMRARGEGVEVTAREWEEAIDASYGEVQCKPAEEWWEGAPTDRDKYIGVRLVTVWPKADHRWGGDRKEYGGLYRARVTVDRQEELREEVGK